jgi:hypothetical protein
MLGLALTPRAMAHEGPPFPIIVDRELPGFQISVWADPDIGEARFYIVLERPGGNDAPDIQPRVSLWVAPVNGRLDRVAYPATEQPQRHRLQYFAAPYFDQRDWWNVGVTLAVPGQPVAEVVAKVESTPPGLGAWDLAIYVFPFVMFGGLWVIASVRKRARMYGRDVCRRT